MQSANAHRPAHRTISILLTALLLASVLAPVAPAAAAGAVVWVGPTGSDASGAGTRANPYRSITVGMTHAASGDQVRVLPGTYSQASGETFPLTPPSGLWVRGIGPGKPKIQGAYQTEVFSIIERSARISGFEITGGGAGSGTSIGGAFDIFNTTGAPVVTIEDCWIHDNTTGANAGGGGIRANGPNPAVGTLTVRWCTVENNTAYGDGGGIYAVGVANVGIAGCTIRDNEAVHTTAAGGGVSISRASSLSMSETEISANSAGLGGTGGAGGLYAYSSTGTLSDLLITHNTGNANGCAGELQACNLDVHGCTIADNETANPAATTAFVISGPGTQTVRLHNSIVWGNTPANVSGVGLTVDKLCTDDPSYHSPPDVLTDPRFVAPDADHPNYRLLRTSLAIDMIGTAAPPDSTDLDGRPRISDGNDSGIAHIDCGAYEAMCGVTRRLWGADRYGTANALWKATLRHANSAVLAIGTDFPDALSASALAGAVDGPLLLVNRNGLLAGTLPVLQSLGVTGIYIVGGTGVIPNTVKSQLEGLGFNVVRIAGANRYATSAEVAREVRDAMGGAYQNRVIVARGDDFPDALASSPWAYAEGIPVLLTEPTSLPTTTAQAIATGGKSGVYIVGGTSAVSAGVASDIAKHSLSGPPVRIAGANRFATAVEVAYAATGIGPNGVASPVLSWHEVGLATGALFPDALTGGSACGAQGGVVLLTDWQLTNSPTADALFSQRNRVYRVTAFGGPVVMSQHVVDAAGAQVSEPDW